jgi:hypothetical protein
MVPKDRRGLGRRADPRRLPDQVCRGLPVSTITLNITSQAQYSDWGWCVQPALAKCAAAVPAMAANIAARSEIGGVVPVARRPTQSKGT